MALAVTVDSSGTAGRRTADSFRPACICCACAPTERTLFVEYFSRSLMRLTTIGTGTVSPSASRVCAGHLVTAGRASVLLDCGSGVVHRLARAGADWMAISHVAITHFHADHLSDLAFLIFTWRYGAEHPRSQPVDIIGPPGMDALLTRFADAFGAWVREPGYELRVHEAAPGATMDLGADVRLSAFKVPHTDESVAYDIVHGAHRVVYTGDTGFDEGLGRWAAGCDLLLAECSLPDDREWRSISPLVDAVSWRSSHARARSCSRISTLRWNR